MQTLALPTEQPHWLHEPMARYTSHGLADLNNAQLMNRVDTKFMVPTKILPSLLNALSDDFSMLEINGRRIFQYESTYFDTPNLLFYHQHHSGRLNRFKIRFRDYVDTDARFLEVKFKCNKKRTAKNRVLVPNDEVFILDHYRDFLASLNVPRIDDLKPTLVNRYQRIALASEARAERLTIDVDLRNSANADASECALGPLAILELKQSRITRSSPVFQLLRSWQVRPRSFSKYCMGLAMAYDDAPIKINRFKKILHYIQRSQHGDRFSVCSV